MTLFVGAPGTRRRGRLARWGTAAVATALVGALVALPTTASAVAVSSAPPLTFGIYPGGYAGGGSMDGKPDDPAKIDAALDTLQGNAGQFLIRDYIACDTPFPDSEASDLGPGRRLDLVVSYEGENMADWRTCLRRDVQRYGPVTATISVTLEANFPTVPNTDPALVQGVIAAKQAARQLGFDRLQIGFDEVAYGQPSTQFWQTLASLGGTTFSKSVDYVGVEVYPDVPFPGVPPQGPIDFTSWLGSALNVVRTEEMPIAGLGASVPVRIKENGWATAATRTPAQQQANLTTEINAINADRAADNILSYELFDLRDDVTGSPNIFDQFGIMTDDYTPKPMFWTYRHLIAALGRH